MKPQIIFLFSIISNAKGYNWIDGEAATPALCPGIITFLYLKRSHSTTTLSFSGWTSAGVFDIKLIL